MISLSITSGHSDAAVVLRTVHRDNNSLQSYRSVICPHGEAQLQASFGGSPLKKRRTKSMSELAKVKLVRTNCLRPLPSAGRERRVREVKLHGAHLKKVELFVGSFTASNCTTNISVDNRHDGNEVDYG